MIIREIHIYGFGKFHDFRLDNLQSGVQIFEGENEAGKTTLLHFLRYTLFGYPSRKTKKPQYEPLDGGKHGGRILVELQDGRKITVERMAGSKNGVLRLFEGERVIENPDYWQRLTAGADLSLYENIYAFSLEELSSLASLDQSGMQDRISNALLGLKDISLKDIEKELSEKAAAIHHKNKRKSEIISLVKEYAALEEEIEKLRAGLPHYEALSTEIAGLEEETEEKERQKRKLKEKAAFLERAMRSRKHLNRIREAEEHLAGLPSYQGFPEKYAEEMKRIEVKLEEAAGAQSKLQSRAAELEAMRKGKAVDEKFISMEAAIRALLRETGKYEVVLKEIADFDRQWKDHEFEIERFLQDHDLSFSREELSALTGLETLKSRIRALESALRDKELRLAASGGEEKPSLSGKRGLMLLTALLLMAGGLLLIVATAYDLAGAALTGLSAFFFILSARATGEKRGGQSERLEAEIEKLRFELAGILEEAGLPGTLTAHDALELINSLEKERDSLRALLRKKKETEEKRDFARQFEEKVKELAEELPGSDPLALLDELAEKMEKAKEALKERESMDKELTLARNDLLLLRDKIEALERKEQELLERCGAGSRMEFWAIMEKDGEAGHWLAEKKSARAALRDEVGEQNLDKVREYLEKNTPAQIENRLRETREQLERAEEEIKRLNTEKGYKESERKHLASSESLNTALSRQNNLQTRIRELRSEWLSYELALKLLSDVKDDYEKEKQPMVIRYASAFFNRISEGAYPQISVPVGESEFMVIDRWGGRKSIAELSRGTREQLLISIRLGLIAEYEEHNEALPVVMDDVMVNFDPQRAGQSAAVLQEFAGKRQVLYFTCHPQTAKYFQKKAVHDLGN